jgi:hypothetical protein
MNVLKAGASLLGVVVLAGCTLAASPGPSISPAPFATPGPSGGAALTEGDLRLAIVDRFGPRWYCDPDFYPIQREDEQTAAIERFAEMQQEAVIFAAVVHRLGLDGTTTFTDAQKLAIYQLWKPLLTIPLDPIGNGRYRFDYTAQPVGGAAQGTRSAGTISETGEIVVEQQASADAPNCPICLARGTPIATPAGDVAVESLRLGDRVWTLDAVGRRVIGKVIALGSTLAPSHHHVVHLVLADGRSVVASPGHPLADGRSIGSLVVGDLVDGSRVVTAELLPYDDDRTFDVVVSGSTGSYFGGGIPLGSTLAPPAGSAS